MDSTDGGNEEELNFPHFDEHDGRFKNADNSDYNYSAEYDQDYEVTRVMESVSFIAELVPFKITKSRYFNA